LASAKRLKKIDLVCLRPSTGELILILVETEDWGADGARLLELQEKFHAYLDFVETGKVWERFPEHAGKPIRFRLDHTFPLGSNEMKFLEAAQREWLNPLGIGLESGSLDGRNPGDIRL
jgi:hypothetical protein